MPAPTNICRQVRFATAAAAAALLGACAIGCGGSGAEDFEEFEQLDLREKLVEVPFGDYAVPVPVVTTGGEGGIERNNLLEITLTVVGLVGPEFEEETVKLIERHRGQIRDGVIRVCRNTSVEDLLDPQMSTLRSRILDATQPLLERVTLRRVLITRRDTAPL